MLPGDTLSFGPFKFEPHSGRLTKRGYKIKLQPKAATALFCLVEQAGEVVSRAQLQARLWPEGTFVDFDLGIKGTINKLRDALGDDSEGPTYIQTVHGEGYRFLAPVSVVRPESNGHVSRGIPFADTPVASPDPVLASPRSNQRQTIWFGAMVGIVTLVIPAFLIPRVASTPPVNFQNRDWVVIAAFENRTGEKLLDSTMEFALERALAQSRYVNVAPRDRVNDTLRLMRQSPSAVLSEELARQVAVRDGGIKAVLAGRVEKFGPKYVLTVRLVDPSRGDTIAVFEQEGTENQLPAAARSLSDDVRRKLGETENSLGTGLAEVAKATTPSLAAFRAFSAGMLRVNERDPTRAAPLFEEAVLQDPQFASAHIFAAHSYSNLQQPEKAAPHYETAFQLAPGVSQRERLFILGSYYSRYLHDDRLAVDAYHALVTLYPDDYWGVNNLFVLYGSLRMYRERNEVLERLVALRPNERNSGQIDELWNYYRFDSPDMAKAKQFSDILRRWRTSGMAGPAGTWAQVDSRLDLEVATDRWFGGDVKTAAQEVTRVSRIAQTHRDAQYKRQVVGASLALGRLAEAKALCDTVVDPIVRTECLLRVAYAGGNRELGRGLLSQLRSSGPSPGNAVMDLQMFARFGETTIPKRFFEGVLEPNTKGWLLLAEGHFAEAAKQLQAQSLTRFSYPFNRFPLAIALERLGKPEEAIAGLEEEDLPHRDLCLNWTWPQCRAKLAELYRKVGRIDDAVKVENQLRHYLSEADPDYPILAQLRAIEAAAPKIARAK